MDEKTLGIVGDMMKLQASATVKSDFFTKNLTDPGLKSLCRQAGKMHRSHFKAFLSYITSRQGEV
ncbi:MAG: hypothetical protein E7388_05600 [Ruminococcaceae bacterium]|nr:hypothetical protein [Oscillospiraceae bacterium]